MDVPNRTLPASWGNAFPSLVTLELLDMPLTGTLPAFWGSNGSWPALGFLELGSSRTDQSCLSGTLPPGWGSPTVWQQLQKLYITGCLEGKQGTYADQLTQ